MIIIGFIIITSILLLFAHIGGNVGYFINLDSIALVIIPGILFSIFTFKWKEYVDGIKLLFCFNKKSIRQNQQLRRRAAEYVGSSLVVVFGFITFFNALKGRGIKPFNTNKKTASHFKSLIYVTIGFGFLSTVQGLFSYILARRDFSQNLIELSDFALNTTFSEACVYASFTIVYAVLISAFVYYPIVILKKIDE